VTAGRRGARSRWVAGVALLGIVLGLSLFTGRVRAAGESTATPATVSAPAAAAPSTPPAGAAARGDDDDWEEAGAAGSSRWALGSIARRSGWLTPLLLAAAFYFLFMRGRGAGGGWGSYYLFWIVAPVILAAVSSHPAVLLVVVVGFLARRWLPDPFLFLRYQSRIGSLQTEVSANPGNATARRDLARIWLEKHRPRRALPLLAEALARDPEDKELHYLQGLAELAAGQHAAAVETFIALVQRDPSFRYGEAYLRAGDALIALERWDDADDALERFARINSSSIEGRYKRARVKGARKDADGRRAAVRDLREVWRALPSFQRRHQLGWYLRALVLG
jgi:tetratricopeptide (TPR) repeat protein